MEDLSSGRRRLQSIRQGSVQDLYTAQGMIAKFWSSLNTHVSLQGSVSFLQRPIIRQGESLDTFGAGYALFPKISLAPFSWISLDCDAAYQVNFLRTPYYRSQTQSWSIHPRLSLHFLQHWFASCTEEASWIDLPTGTISPSHFLGASLRYQSRHWTVQLSGENLLNETEQVTSRYSSLDEYLLHTRLRPRSIELSLSWRY